MNTQKIRASKAIKKGQSRDDAFMEEANAIFLLQLEIDILFDILWFLM